MVIKITFNLTEQQKADLQAFAEYMDKYHKTAVGQAELHVWQYQLLKRLQDGIWDETLKYPKRPDTQS